MVIELVAADAALPNGKTVKPTATGEFSSAGDLGISAILIHGTGTRRTALLQSGAAAPALGVIERQIIGTAELNTLAPTVVDTVPDVPAGCFAVVTVVSTALLDLSGGADVIPFSLSNLLALVPDPAQAFMGGGQADVSDEALCACTLRHTGVYTEGESIVFGSELAVGVDGIVLGAGIYYEVTFLRYGPLGYASVRAYREKAQDPSDQADVLITEAAAGVVDGECVIGALSGAYSNQGDTTLGIGLIDSAVGYPASFYTGGSSLFEDDVVILSNREASMLRYLGRELASVPQVPSPLEGVQRDMANGLMTPRDGYSVFGTVQGLDATDVTIFVELLVALRLGA